MDIDAGLKERLSTLIVEKCKDKEVALLLSGGVDSIALLLLLKELGYSVTTYTFHLAGVSSTDLERADNTARLMNVPNVKIRLSNSLQSLINDLFQMCRDYEDIKTKVDFECFWPLLKSFNVVKERTIITGLGCDGHFGTSKKAMIHYRNNAVKFKEERLKLFYGSRYVQFDFCQQYEKYSGKTIFSPYRQTIIADFLVQYDWYELNIPRQKWAIVKMFESDFSLLGAPRHSGFQKGDSEISALFERLVHHSINVRGCKTSAGVFNQIKDIVKDEKLPGSLPYRSQGNLFT